MLDAKKVQEYSEQIKEFGSELEKFENRTRTLLIDYILRDLGWDIVSLQTDYPVKGLTEGKDSVDYALLGTERSPQVFVEAKKLNSLQFDDLQQLKRYMQKHVMQKGSGGFSFGVLADGNTWRFYPFDIQNGAERFGDWCYEVALDAMSPQDVAENLNELLYINNVRDNSAQKVLEDKFKTHNIVAAWKEIRDEQLDTLVKQVQKRVLNKTKTKPPAEEVQRIIAPDKIPDPVIEPPVPVGKGPFSFNMIRLKPGAKLYFSKDSKITCTVHNDKEVQFRGKIMSLSQAAKKALAEKDLIWKTAQGPAFWCYNGKKLVDIRKEIGEK